MLDAKNREVQVGHRVVFSVGTKLLFGTVVTIKQKRRYEYEWEEAKVALEVPEERQRRGRWEANPDLPWGHPEKHRFILDEVQPPPRTTRNVSGQHRIAILDNILD